jgi:ferredoxin--NADP+ reductase
MPASAPYNASVVQRVEVAPGLIILRVVPDAPLRFQAGQWTTLGLRASEPRLGEPAGAPGVEPDGDRLIRRAYSIASSSKQGEYLEFYLTLVGSGELTPRLFRLGLKSRLFVGPKVAGLFTLDRVPAGVPVLLVGTGTGLAPYMSMLRSELEHRGPRRFVVLHGARYSWDLGYRAELMTLARICPNLVYIPVISRRGEDPTWSGPSGYLQDMLVSGLVEERAGLALRPENLHVFLCGNPGMIQAARDRLVERGFVADRGRQVGSVHMEEYW